MKENGLELVLDMFRKYPMQYIGLVGLDGKPKVKPFEFKIERDGKLYFDVLKSQETYREIENNPYVEVTVANKEKAEWIRLSGKVRFVLDPSLRRSLIAASPILRSVCESDDDENVVPFTLDEVKVDIASLDKSRERICFSLA